MEDVTGLIFAGTLAEREYGNKLAAGEEYKKEFTITIK